MTTRQNAITFKGNPMTLIGPELKPGDLAPHFKLVGNNLAELSQELEKLALFAGPENTLSPALVTQLASHSRTYNIFALVEALGEPGFHQRLTSLGHLLDLGEAPPKNWLQTLRTFAIIPGLILSFYGLGRLAGIW